MPKLWNPNSVLLQGKSPQFFAISRSLNEKNVTIQHVPLFVIPAFSGDRKGDAEMPESHILLFQGMRFRYFSPFLFAEWQKKRNDNLNIEIADMAE